jgi:hypothetical protein
MTAMVGDMDADCEAAKKLAETAPWHEHGMMMAGACSRLVFNISVCVW